MGKNDLPEEKLARRKVNAEVRYGKRPHPNTLPCATCGHVWKEGERRHEYDHTLPLDKPENWTVVQAVCTTCHHGHTGERAEEDAVVTAVKRGPQATAERQSRIEYMPLASLKSHPRNPKDHDIPALVASIQRFGFNDAVIIDERTGQLVSGHGRVEALRAMAKEWDPRAHEPGSKALPSGILLQAGEWTVPVQRGYSSKDDTEAEAFIVAANKLVESGGWDDTNLEAILADLAQANALDGTGFDMTEVDRILADAAVRDFEGQTDPDDVPPQPEPTAKLGDVFQLGRHRLMCGDSTDAASVSKLLDGAKPHLMVTDPPYGVEYDAGWRNEVMGSRGAAVGKVLNDDRADWREAWALFPGEVAYVWFGSLAAHTVAHSLLQSGFELRSLIIWAKSSLAISRGHYHWQHEPCWYAVREGGTAHWAGDRKQSTLWEIEKPKKSETGHSTQKPVECMRRPMVNNSAPGDSVYEPFSGSGTTIIAAEETGRVCFAMELSPVYVDLAVARWEAFTGQKAVKL